MAVTLFEHLNHIYEVQDINYFNHLEEADKKTFNTYIVSRFISMNPDYLPVVNELQQYWGQIGQREAYLFYSQILPRKKQYNKYIKGTKDSSPYEDWVRELIAQHYEISKWETDQYLRILYTSMAGKASLKDLLEGYGIDEKKLKKAGL